MLAAESISCYNDILTFLSDSSHAQLLSKKHYFLFQITHYYLSKCSKKKKKPQQLLAVVNRLRDSSVSI